MDDTVIGIAELSGALRQLQAKSMDAAKSALSRIGMLAQRESKRNANRSPTMKQLSATLKRKKRTKQRTFPGGLEKSIEWELIDFEGEPCASVFVAANSYAGKYAKRIHDEKGKTWAFRGPGTIAKGDRADEKFISRAIEDNEKAFEKIVKSEMRKVEL